MNSRRRGRQVLLFVSTILIPAVVLIYLGVLLVRQESELADKRAADQRRDALEQLRRELSARLETIKVQTAARGIQDSRPEIVFVGRLEQDRMILPWEKERKPAKHSPEFFKYQSEGESQEFMMNAPAAAVRAYEQAFSVSSGVAEKCEASLWIGRALSKAGEIDKAARTYQQMLNGCDSAADDDDISYGLYAAERL